MNRFITSEKAGNTPSNRFSSKKNAFTRSQTKGSSCPQYSEVEVAPDDFIKHIFKFFFDETDAALANLVITDSLRELAATLVNEAIDASRLMDLIPRPTGSRPGALWLITTPVQIAWRRAMNGCKIYEAVRLTIKRNFITDYRLKKMDISQSYYSRSFTNTLALSANGQTLLKRFEGFRGRLYNDAAGHCTIGYGHLVHHGNCNGTEDPTLIAGIDEPRASDMMMVKVNEIERLINTTVSVSLNQNQFDALISFVYNIGNAAFSRSTLLRLLNEGGYNAVPEELRKWVHAGGVVLPGLVTRRNAEAELFTSQQLTAAKSISNKFSKPLYDTGEHAILGTIISEMTDSPLSDSHVFDPTNTYSIHGVPFTYGQIMTLGDFYDSYQSCVGASVAELTRMKALIERGENHYRQAIFVFGPSEENPEDDTWADPVRGIGSRYEDLALNNYSHFAPAPAGIRTSKTNNKSEWNRYHEMAIKRARAGTGSDDLDAALSINAFGDHFLTDAFSAGHLINKESVIDTFLRIITPNGSITSAGKTLLDSIASKVLAIPALNNILGKFELKDTEWGVHWNLNDDGRLLPDIFYRILIKLVEDTKHGGNKKIANFVVKIIHDHLNRYNNNQGVPVKNQFDTWNLNGDGRLTKDNLKNIRMIQKAVLQSANNISDAVMNPGTSIATYQQRVWAHVPDLTYGPTKAIVDDAISRFTNPNSVQLAAKAVALVGNYMDTLLNELIKEGYIRCINNYGAKSVKECR